MSLRTGYTTGSCATAAARAATIGLFQGNIPDEVEIKTPIGVKLCVKILDKHLTEYTSECSVQKDAGDDPDITHGCKVHARVERNDTNTIEIDGGEGVGRVTKPGLQVAIGQAAINPVPRRMIKHAVREVAGEGAGMRITISVPNGKLLAEKTFNSRLGIVGGISIIGTTGIVRPMSEDAFKHSLLCGLDIARGYGYETVVFVPGNIGERSIHSLTDIPADQVVQMSNFVGFMLEAALKRNFKRVILAGHPGKLIKLIRGDFHTHSAVSQPANDILIGIMRQSQFAHILSDALQPDTTIEGIVEILRDYGHLSLMHEVAEKIEIKVLEFCKDKRSSNSPAAGIILFDMKGSVIGISRSAQTWLNSTKTKSSS